MKKSLLAVVIGLTMLVPSLAFASSSSCAYNTTCTTSSTSAPTTTAVPTTAVTTTSVSPTSTAATTASSTLPFTGLDLVALLTGASVLVGAGLVVRRLSRDPHN